MKTIVVDGWEVDVVEPSRTGSMVCLTTPNGESFHLTWQDAMRLSTSLMEAAAAVVAPDDESRV